MFAPTAARLFDVGGFSRKWLRSVRDDQLPDGRIVNASPDHARLKTIENPEADIITGSAGWGDAIVLVPWTLYEMYGDDRVLAENFDAMVRWVEWALRRARDHHHPSRAERAPHHEFLWDGTFHWGEWCEPKQRAADGCLIDPVASDLRFVRRFGPHWGASSIGWIRCSRVPDPPRAVGASAGLDGSPPMPPMSKVEVFAAIRRDSRAGMSVRALTRKYEVSRRTVRSALSSAWPAPRKPMPPRPSKLDAFKPIIDDILRTDQDAPRKQRHTIKRIYDRLIDEHGMREVS
ncbi:transposase [Actinoplanes couchii]|uniref:alpha-L-rhamnosidase n=1 Tax=Actinoplanes couchii TaxID=403638 RepID=A0ABQ3XSW5_9ACTN|nr:transposase [Actinoplanes couchii]GID61598.1 hypothetical protein Aco03nite_100020 [Actinoplanes couchii]